MNNTVGIVGLGNAGSCLAMALAKHFTVIGHDTDTSRQQALADDNIQWADSIESLAQSTDTVLLSLPHPNISRSVIESLISASTNLGLIIETSTITPKVARELDKTCRQDGIAFADAAIIGGLKAMASGKTAFLLGAEDDEIVAARRVLEPISSRIYHLGGVGAGSGAKIVNNAVMHAEMVILVEAAAMAEKLGIPAVKLIDILEQPTGLMRPLKHRLKDRVLNDDYENGMSVTNARKDSTLALEVAQDLGVPLFATLAAHTPYEIAERLGYGSLDYAVIANLWENWCDIRFSDKDGVD